jgi:hypothetical protein
MTFQFFFCATGVLETRVVAGWYFAGGEGRVGPHLLGALLAWYLFILFLFFRGQRGELGRLLGALLTRHTILKSSLCSNFKK